MTWLLKGCESCRGDMAWDADEQAFLCISCGRASVPAAAIDVLPLQKGPRLGGKHWDRYRQLFEEAEAKERDRAEFAAALGLAC